jgi:hypothetical protein
MLFLILSFSCKAICFLLSFTGYGVYRLADHAGRLQIIGMYRFNQRRGFSRPLNLFIMRGCQYCIGIIPTIIYFSDKILAAARM